MVAPDELLSILERILPLIERDSSVLEGWSKTEDGQKVVQFIQIGKYNTNFGRGEDISIGDGLDKKLLEEVRDLLRSQLPPPLPKIDWQQVSRSLLDEQIQRLTTNPLTHAEGITYRTEQVYVPLGLVERKRQARRREDVSPEQGSLLYEETEITQKFEHEAFLEQVLRQGHSPRSGGRRIAVIGEPGAGKTTLLQQIARWVSENIEGAIAIWVSLADLQGQELEDYLLKRWLPAVVQQVGQAEASTQVKDAFVAQIQQGRVWLLLDGVDEMQVSSSSPLSEIERQVRLGGLLSQTRIVLTCRLNLWDGNHHALDTFDTYRTLEFSYPVQVEQFVGQWFGALPDAQAGQAERLCAALKQPGKERIRDLVKNPLRLTLLCFNWYLGEGTLPETKAGLYKQFVADFYEWKREQFPTTAEQRRQLNAALGHLSRESIDKEATRFRLRHDFVCKYLGEPDAPNSLFRLALQLGWLNQVGVDAENRRNAVYAFFHPTFQEYFAALAISDWHFFFNHIPENPSCSDASYRVFKACWREVIFLWLGRNFDSAVQKEQLLSALVTFEDGCGNENLYGNRAKLLAAVGLSEFRDFSRAEELVNHIFGQGIREIEVFNNPMADSARKILQEMHPSVLAGTLAILLRSEDTYLQHAAAKLAGEIRLDDVQVVEALTELARQTEFKDTRYEAYCSLLKIKPSSAEAIESLITILHDRDEYSLSLGAAICLGVAENGNVQVIEALQEFIENHLLLKNQTIFSLEQYAVYSAASSLLGNDPENETARRVLQRIAKECSDPATRSQIAKLLSKYGIDDSSDETSEIDALQKHLEEDMSTRLSQLDLSTDLGTMPLLEALINIMINDSNQSTRKKAAWCLELVMHDYLSSPSTESYSQVVSWLKHCLYNSPDRSNTQRTLISVGSQDPVVACYKGLWGISQYLDFPSFHRAWNA